MTPIGTRVAVFRVDGVTKVGNGTIEEWTPYFHRVDDNSITYGCACY